MAHSSLFGRDPEVEALRAACDAVSSGPVGILIQGEAGIGKTSLLRELLAEADKRGFLLLRAQPVESETQLSYAALGDLLEPVVDDLAGEVPGHHARTLDVALLRADPAADPADGREVGVALREAFRVLAGRGPLLVAVDDLQWIDRPSARALAFALRRLDAEPVGFAGARRPRPPDLVWTALERSLPPERLHHLDIGPVDVDAVDALVRDRLGVGLPRPFLVRLHRGSGGNPFYAVEIARALQRRGLPLVPDERLPLPDSLRSLVLEPVATLPAPARDGLLTVAALSNPTPSLLRDVWDDLEPAFDRGVLTLDGDRVRFSHPLLRSAVYATVAGPARGHLHRRLAVLVTDPEEQARHLALVTDSPDPGVAGALDAAAARAVGRGAPDAAAALAEDALRLTAPEDGPARRRRCLLAAQQHATTGNSERAATLLKEAAALSRPGTQRALPLVLLGKIRQVTGPLAETAGIFEAALADSARDPELETRVRAELAFTHVWAGNPRAAAPYAAAALAAAEHLGDATTLASAMAAHGLVAFFRAEEPDPGIVERFEHLGLHGDVPVDRRPALLLASRNRWLGDLEGPRRVYESELRAATDRGDDADLPFLLGTLAHLECLVGNAEAADGYAENAVALARQTGQSVRLATILSVRALVDARLGRVAAARAAATEGIELGARTGAGPAVVVNVGVIGFLELSLGDAAAAHERLGPLAQLSLSSGMVEPSVARWLPDEVEALVALGEPGAAGELLDPFEERAQALDRPWPVAAALRCRGALLAAGGDRSGAIATLEGAVRAHERVQEPFELGRTLLMLGTVARRAKQKRAARDALGAARDAFRATRSPLWAARADQELAGVGAAAAAPGELTPTEERVAGLAATGSTNREIADALLMSPKTVGHHLSRVYAKLGIRSRTQLAARVTAAPRAEN